MIKIQWRFIPLFMWAMLACSTVHAQSFEGEVDFQVNSGTAKAGQITFLINDTKIRMNLSYPANNLVAIADLSTNKVDMLYPDNKTGVETVIMPVDKQESVELVSTGKTAVILGQQCSEWTFDDKANTRTVSVWAASGMDDWMGIFDIPVNILGKVGEAVEAKGLFPLKFVYTDSTGKILGSIQAVNLTKKTIDSSNFVVPSGYKITIMGTSP